MSLEGKHESNLLRANRVCYNNLQKLAGTVFASIVSYIRDTKAGDVAAAAETKHFLAVLSEYNQNSLVFNFFPSNWPQIGNLGFAYGNCFFREWHVKPMGLQLQVSSDAFKALLSQSFGIKPATCRSSRAELRKAAKTLGLPLKLADEITLAALKQLL